MDNTNSGLNKRMADFAFTVVKPPKETKQQPPQSRTEKPEKQ